MLHVSYVSVIAHSDVVTSMQARNENS